MITTLLAIGYGSGKRKATVAEGERAGEIAERAGLMVNNSEIA